MVNPELDFVTNESKDKRLVSLVDSIMGTAVGRDRKSVLTSEQALAIARARTYADSFIVYKRNKAGELVTDENGNPIMLEGPLEEVHMLCDYLEDTAVSTGGGRGLKDLVAVMSARMTEDERSEGERLRSRVMS